MKYFEVDLVGKTIAEVVTNADARGLSTDALIAFTDGTLMQIGVTESRHLISTPCLPDDRAETAARIARGE